MVFCIVRPMNDLLLKLILSRFEHVLWMIFSFHIVHNWGIFLVLLSISWNFWSSLVSGWEEFMNGQVCSSLMQVPNKPIIQNGHENQRQYTRDRERNQPASKMSPLFFQNNHFCTKSRFNIITKTNPDPSQVHQNSNHQRLEATKQETNTQWHCPQAHSYKEKYFRRLFISLNHAKY